MIFLHFLVDVCFYNFTPFKTDFLLLEATSVKNNKLMYFFSIIAIDLLLYTQGKIILLFTILFFLNQFLKISYQNISKIFLRFFYLYFFYKIGIFLLFHTFVFDLFGFLFNLLLLYLWHKKFIS